MGRLQLRHREYENASSQFEKMLGVYQNSAALTELLSAEEGSLYPMYTQALGEMRHIGHAEGVLGLREAYIELLQYFRQLDPGDEQILAHLADSYIALGTAQERDGHTVQDRETFGLALAVLLDHTIEAPDNENL